MVNFRWKTGELKSVFSCHPRSSSAFLKLKYCLHMNILVLRSRPNRFLYMAHSIVFSISLRLDYEKWWMVCLGRGFTCEFLRRLLMKRLAGWPGVVSWLPTFFCTLTNGLVDWRMFFSAVDCIRCLDSSFCYLILSLEWLSFCMQSPSSTLDLLKDPCSIAFFRDEEPLRLEFDSDWRSSFSNVGSSSSPTFLSCISDIKLSCGVLFSIID